VIVPIASERLVHQLLARPGRIGAVDVVGWFGAVQAQEYGPAKWAIGQRARARTTDADVQQALDDGRIVRTHVMRPTWHFVVAEDCRWLLELTAPQVHKRMATYDRRLGLDAKAKRRGTAIIERALRDRRYLTRQELRQRLARAKLPLDATRLAHLCLHAELERVICSGPRRGRQSTYALFDERLPATRRLSRDEALAELARRFFQSHGPATIRDLVWWSGLATPDAKRAIDMWSGGSSDPPSRLRRLDAGGLTYWSLAGTPPRARRSDRAHLLPIYDEYLVAYRDRAAVPHGSLPMMSFRPGAPLAFQHPLVVAGQVAGTWRVVSHAGSLSIEVAAARRLTTLEKQRLDAAADSYGRFIAAPVTLSIAAGRL
jgi:hypothetical protein